MFNQEVQANADESSSLLNLEPQKLVFDSSAKQATIQIEGGQCISKFQQQDPDSLLEFEQFE